MDVHQGRQLSGQSREYAGFQLRQCSRLNRVLGQHRHLKNYLQLSHCRVELSILASGLMWIYRAEIRGHGKCVFAPQRHDSSFLAALHTKRDARQRPRPIGKCAPPHVSPLINR